jgi:NAD(P)-dependent dehydrogenase (short-subunit alcohol dehydrogenase family)
LDLGIKDRRAIVTGGGSGIGRATARLFLQEGVRVTICGRNAEKLAKARDELASCSVSCAPSASSIR